MSDRMRKAVEEVYKAVKAAEQIAEEEKETFSLDVSYGMGGVYYPRSSFMTYEELLKAIEEGTVSAEDAKYLLEEFNKRPYKKNSYLANVGDDMLVSEDEIGWRSSSSMC